MASFNPLILTTLFSCFFLHIAYAFYVPGISIKSYRDGETIPLLVNKVYSDNTQIQYAYSELPFVCPASGRKYGNLRSGSSISLNLGEIFRGDRIVVSDYELTMGNDEELKYLCSQKIDRSALAKAQEVVSEGYVAEWIVDNLPGATRFVTVDKTRKYYAAGFKMGYEDTSLGLMHPRYYINNHVTLVIRYHKAPGAGGRQGKKVIVGFEVYPKSIGTTNRDQNGLPQNLQDSDNPMELTMYSNMTYRAVNATDYSYLEDVDGDDENASLVIPYTYSVYFREEEHIDWANRWDLYFVNQEDSVNIHWFAIINSLVIAGLLSAVVAVILARAVRGDIKVYKDSALEEGKSKKRAKPTRSPRKSTDKGTLLDPLGEGVVDAAESDDEELVEDITGWKLVHGDVFRSPAYGHFLAPIAGSGVQLIFTATGLLILSCLGVLNPSFRGGFISVGFGLFVFAGLFSGYFSARLYKTFGGQLWKRNVLVTATLFPGLLFATTFILNLFVWAQASSTALPFGTLLALVTLWALIQLPLVYVGSWYAYAIVGAWEHPIKATVIPRQIPYQVWYMRPIPAALLFGLIPFGIIFIELLFLFKSVWQDKSGYYYVFGFLAVISVILALSVVEVTIVAIYLQLCNENYHWWWHSFFVGGGSSVWIFAYCCWFYVVRLHVHGFVSGLLFFSYSFLACIVFGLLTGTVGFLAAYTFVKRIYSAIKVD